jgi:hypothetical protein
VDAIEQL